MYLFTARSLLTMLHGVVLSGVFLLCISSAIYSLRSLRADGGITTAHEHRAFFSTSTLIMAVALWATLFLGMYAYSLYRIPPPEGAQDLANFPRAALLANPATKWLHEFAMEAKEHLPWALAMLMTAVAFIARRYGGELARNGSLRTTLHSAMLACFVVFAFVGMLGIFVNKVAPLQ